jgi:hypothetical protein
MRIVGVTRPPAEEGRWIAEWDERGRIHAKPPEVGCRLKSNDWTKLELARRAPGLRASRSTPRSALHLPNRGRPASRHAAGSRGQCRRCATETNSYGRPISSRSGARPDVRGAACVAGSTTTRSRLAPPLFPSPFTPVSHGSRRGAPHTCRVQPSKGNHCVGCAETNAPNASARHCAAAVSSRSSAARETKTG